MLMHILMYIYILIYINLCKYECSMDTQAQNEFLVHGNPVPPSYFSTTFFNIVMAICCASGLL